MASGQTTKRTSSGAGSASKTAADKKQTAAKKKTANTSKTSGNTSTGRTNKKTSTTGGKTQARQRNTAAVKRKGSTTAYTREEIKRRNGMYDEVKMIVSLAVAVIMLISTLNFGGKVGGFISAFLFGTFGWLGYLIPYIVFFGTAFLISNRRNKIIRKKIAAFLCFAVCLMAFLQMMASPFDATTKIVDYYKNCAIYKNGGGIIGGAICYVLTPLFGKIGCYVIIIIGMALGIVFMAQRAIFTVMLKKFRDWLEEYKEYRAEKRRIKEEMRMQAYEDTYGDGDDEEDLDELYDEEDEEDLVQKTAVKHGVRTGRKSFAEERYDTGASDAVRAEFVSGDFKLADVDIEPPVESIPIDETVQPEKSENRTDEEVSAANTQPEITVTHMEPIRFENMDDQAGEADEDVMPPYEVPAGVGDQTVRLPEKMAELAEDAGSGENMDNDVLPLKAADDQAAGMSPDAGSAVEGEGISAQTVSVPTAPKKATAKETEPVTAEEIAPPVKEYIFPPMTLLKKGSNRTAAVSDAALKETAMKLQNTLDSFGVKVQVTNVSCGPSVTRYELTPDQGVKVSKIVALSDDIKLNLAVADIRIEAPIPGKSSVGIEVPNKENTMVLFRDLIESKEFQKRKSNVSFAVGRDISGQVIVTDIAKMPHLLIAGATGSGKSVCINTLIMSIIYKSKPEDVRLIMVDPKVVELSVYNGIPHLLIPVVTDPKKAAGALNWAVMEMTDRYNKFAQLGVRDIRGYNEKIENSEYESETYKKMPQIVIIVDELADLMMVASSEVEDAICRLAQLARAAGIHLVIATQRPSVNVITGLIKANIPSRIAFAVSSGVDSRTIIDMNGAEKLMGKGDMLFYPAGMQKPLRVQGAFISDKEVNDVTEFLKEQGQTADYSDEVADKISSANGGEGHGHGVERDVYFADAGRFIIEKDKASIGMLQRVYKIGFNRAARIMDQLCEAGVVGPEEGTKPRKVLMSAEEFENYVEEYV